MGIVILMVLIEVSATGDMNVADFNLQEFIDKAIQMKLDAIVISPVRYRIAPQLR